MSLSHPSARRSPLTRSLVLIQIAVQAGMALTPFYSVTVQAARSPFSADREVSTADSAVAGHASTFGQALQSGDMRGAAAQQATGMASQELQQWLSNFGTARVELSTDGNFKPRTGAADLLLPLYKSEDRLLFTQNGIRNVDGQFTGNVGLGQRHFSGDWMVGYNAFYDQNFSRGHKRFSTGAELWRDYLKLSGNGYYRVSGWRNSGDVEDYDARPANGFDLRTEAWLPAYPALGGRLMYEQYYGNEVALFGKDQRQKNPNAVTAGLSWTPVPLVSFTADHKKGGSKSESTFGLQLNWQLGQSLTSQLDASAVGATRTLAGSGMDLVDRNNNIVLDYRKQQLIALFLPKDITGVAGSTQAITYQLTSKYALANIVWNDAAIAAAGGKITDLGAGQYQLVLPKFVAGSANTYTLSGVASDVRGNVSKMSSTTVTVARPAVSATNSTITAAKDAILADGKSTTQITVSLMDDDGQPVGDVAAELSASITEQATEAKSKKAKLAQAPAQPATLSAITEQSTGVYVLTLTSGTRPATAVITPVMDSLTFASVRVQQISDSDSAAVKDGDLQLILDNVVADGKAESRVQARVTDATGNPVAGVTVTFSLSGSAQIASGSSLTTVSDDKGLATLTFTDSVAEAVIVTAATDHGGAQVKATFIADAGSAGLTDGSLSADRTSAVADGSDKITYNAKVTDANGNPVSGATVSWKSDGGSLSGTVSQTGADGIAQVSLTNTLASAVVVSASVNGSTVNAATVRFTADASSPDASKSTLSASVPAIVADANDASVITLSLQDRNGNPISGQTVTFSKTLTGSSLSTVTDNNDGSYSVTLKGTEAGNERISAIINGTPLSAEPASVQLFGDSANIDGSKSSLKASASTVVANGTAQSVITLTLKDRNNNPVVGQTVTFSKTLTGTLLGTVTDNNDGSYNVALSGTTAGEESITASVNGSPLNTAAAKVTLTADAANLDPAVSALSVTPPAIVANGTAESTVTLTLKDKNGNPVSGQAVTFSKTLAGSTFGTVTDNNDGSYSARLTGTTAGEESITANINGSALGATAVKVTLMADASNLDPAGSALAAIPANIVANNTAESTVTLSLKDKNGNPVAGQTVVFTSDLTGSAFGATTDNADGTYSAKLKGTKAGSASVSVSVGGKTLAVAATHITLTADADNLDAAASALSATPPSIVANNTAESTLTLSLKDKNGNPVSGQTVAFTSNLAGSVFGTTTDNADGTYTAKLKGTQAGSASVSVTVGGNALAVAAADVTLTADADNLDATASTLSATPSTIVANNTEESVVMLRLKDVNGNPVSGQAVVFTSSLTGSAFGSTTDNGDGTYSARLKGTKAGSASVSITVAGKTLAVAASGITLTADASRLDATKSALSASEASIIANDTATSVITLSLKDVNDNPVSGQSVELSSNLAGSVLTAVTDNGGGSYTATLKGTKSGTTTISTRVGGVSLNVTTDVTLLADASTAKITAGNLSTNKTSVIANNSDTATYTAIVVDANDNVLAGQTVSWAGNSTGTTLTPSGAKTDAAGKTTATLKGTRAGAVIINAQLDGQAAVNAPSVTLTVPEVPLVNGVDVTAATITSVLNTTEAAVVKNANGHWAGRITFPAASAHPGKSIIIDHSAMMASVLVVNGSNVNLAGSTPVVYTYTSNGSSWSR